MPDSRLSLEEGINALLAPKAPVEQETPDAETQDDDAPLTEEAQSEHLAEEETEEVSDAAPAEEDAEEHSEAAESDDAEEPQSEPLELKDHTVTVMVDGVPNEITVQEAMNGYLRQADYTRKTQEIAAIRQETAQARDSYLETVEQVRKALDDELSDELLATDPQAYIRKKERKEQLEAEQKRLQEEQQAEVEANRQQYIQREKDATLNVIPEWKDPAVYKAEAEEITKFVVEELGFNPAELQNLHDHRALRAFRMAWQAHSMTGDVKKTLKSKEVVKAQKGVKAKGKRPGPKVSTAEKRVADAQKRLAKAGRRGKLDAGADLLLARGEARRAGRG